MNTPHNLKRSLLFVIFVLTFTSQMEAQQPPPKPTSNEGQWQKFESADGEFSVQFPATPRVGQVPFTKGPVSFTRHTHEVGWSGYYLEIDYWDLTSDSEDPDLAVEGGVAGMIRAMEAKGGRLLNRKTITSDNCPGREAVIAIPSSGQKQGFAIGRVFASGSRAYTLVFVSMTDDQTARSASEKFLNSFVIKRSCSSARSVTPTATATKSTMAGTADPTTGWRRIESVEHGFSVLMPGAAQVEAQPTQTTPFKIIHKTFVHEHEQGMFSVEVLGDYPPNFHNAPESMKTLLDITTYSMKRNLEPVGFVITPGKDLQLGKFPGQDFDLKLGPTGKGRAQVFVTSKRVYIIISVMLSGNAPASDVDRFFSSLKITP